MVRYLEDFEPGQKCASGRLSVEAARWPRPVRPSDELHVESEVVEVRSSRSRADQGVIKVRTTTLNQDGEPVQVFVGNLIVLRRSAS